MSERRHQVFVSSTYLDLRAERQEVIQALLELGCIPSGMEMFPASDDTQWTLIKRIIDDCDYYLVIIGNRYGSVDTNGVSYTEREYDYAVSIGVPTLGFLHEAPNEIAVGKSELDPVARERLSKFREKVSTRMCKFWRTAEDLGGKVSRSLVLAMRTHARPGWVRAGGEADPMLIVRLRQQIETLNSQLEEARTRPPEGTGTLAQGDDTINVRFLEGGVLAPDEYSRRMSWNQIFSIVGAVLLGEGSETQMRAALADFLQDDRSLFQSITIVEEVFQTIKVQLDALGLIRLSDRKRSVTDTNVYWALTPYGRTVLTRLRAVLRTSQGEPTGNTTHHGRGAGRSR